ncbi:hypothetical protein O6H91_Y241100 [Diphasiastrum complanatum]|nr:hypothetical protein O6H91_Y241100 [Diphasiastrum complanatum]
MAIAVNSDVTGKIASKSATSFATWVMRISAMIMIFLGTILIPCSASYYAPLLKFRFGIFEHQMWQGVMGFLTQPVLFLLVNLVILSIWATSDATCNDVPVLMKDEKLQSLRVSPKYKSQRGSSSYITSASLCSSNPLIDNARSKVIAPSATFPTARIQVEVKTTHIEHSSPSYEADSKKEVSAFVSEAKTASCRERKRSHSITANPIQRQDCGPTKRNHPRNKISPQTNWDTKKCAANSLNVEAAATARTKFESRSASFPRLPSRLIVRDMSIGEAESDKSGMSCCRPEVIVMEKDELNERIEAFFSKFREQLRKESLCSQ